MNSQSIIHLLELVLGSGRAVAGKSGEISFKCPVCHHHKRKLQVNILTQKWRCWVCSDTKGKSLWSLFKKANANDNQFTQLKELLPELKKKPHYDNPNRVNKLSLPNEFIPLWIPTDDFQYKQAIKYLIRRGVTGFDIIRYKMGYCTNGEYRDMIIIPSYDIDGNLNFFTGRTFAPNIKRKHHSPSVSKDIIGFEYLINWELPITLCEGAFDAIAIKRNAIPLYGKEISDKLRTAIIEQRVKELYITLDTDATDKILDHINYFKNEGVNVYFTELTEKDPSELGFDGVQTLLQNNSKQLSLREMLTKKLDGNTKDRRRI